MKLVFMGTPSFSVPILKKLHEEYKVSLVVTQPDKKVGRKQEIIYSPVKAYALENNIPLFQPFNIKVDFKTIIDLKPDLIITASYGQILPKELFELCDLINVHGSLLPKRRGGAPVQRAIIERDVKTGITLMYMSLKMDAGDIISKKEIKIEETDTTTILMEKLSYLGRDLLVEELPNILNKTANRSPQNENLVTYSPNLTKEDEILDFRQNSDLVISRLNGLLDEPGGSIFVNDTRIKVYNLKKSDIISLVEPTTIISVKKQLLIKTKDGVLEVTLLQEEGKKKMQSKDYLNGQSKFREGGKINETYIFKR